MSHLLPACRMAFAMLAAVCISGTAFAGSSLTIDDPRLSAVAAEHNRKLSESAHVFAGEEARNVRRPYADYEEVKYLIFSGLNTFREGRSAKADVLKNLPAGVQVIIYDSLGAPNSGQQDLSFYARFIEMLRLTRVFFDKTSSSGFWSRDTIPVPVWTNTGRVAGIDAKYYRYFEPDDDAGRFFNIPIYKHNYYHEGGNFMADARGRCLLVNNERSLRVPDSIFQSMYGCASVHRFEFIKGIGHIDERVKLVSDTEAMTDTPEYVRPLEQMGYTVTMLPQGGNYYETYVNSILVNGSVFVPVFGQTTDNQALAAYTKLGLKAFPVQVDELPNSGRGSLHCITMTYPETK